MRQMINPAGFDRIGDIQQATETQELGVVDETFAPLYSNVRSKKLMPLKGSENMENNQEVAIERNSWLIRNENRDIVPNKTKYVVDGKDHHIIGVRDYKGERFYQVLDTEFRDNQ